MGQQGVTARNTHNSWPNGVSLIGQRKGQHLLNQMFFVARFALEHLVLHEPDERRFYSYDASTGAWVLTTADAIKIILSEDLQRFVHETGETSLSQSAPIRCLFVGCVVTWLHGETGCL